VLHEEVDDSIYEDLYCKVGDGEGSDVLDYRAIV